MKKQQGKRSGSTWRSVLFVGVQLVLMVVIVGVSRARLRDEHRHHELPPMRSRPLSVEPLHDRPDFISDEQLLDVLYKLRPRLREEKPKINHVDHALRFWGAEALFHDPECLSGAEMRELLLDNRRFAEAWGSDEKPLLECTEHGVAVRTQEGDASASHLDHTLAGLAEVGTPLDFPVQTSEGPTTVRALLKNSLESFDINQVEYEWSSLAYVLYLRSLAPFDDVYGQETSFDRLADRIMRQRMKKGVCYGNHRLHALVMMLRVDDRHPILGEGCRARIIAHLKSATQTLIASQDPKGFWNQYWTTGVAPMGEDDDEPSQLAPRARKLLATGHVLEWWSLAPGEVLPPDEVIRRAAQWLAAEVTSLDDEQIRRNYTFLTHAGRALALWRGHFPAYFIPAMEARHS